MNRWLGIDYFDQPEALLLLLLIPLYIYWYRRYYRRQRLVVRLSYDPEKLQAPRFRIAWMRLIPRILQVAAMAFLILALARPQKARKITEQQDLGADIVLVLDVSRSMENKDIPPSRFSAAKTLVRSLVESRENDRFALVVFGPTALSSVPLTFDHQFLLEMVERTNGNSLPGEGSTLGMAIGAALNRLRDSDASRKMIMLFSDGASNGGNLDPISAAKLASASGVSIHCVAIGAPASGTSQQSPDLLSEVARRTGGYVKTISSREAITAVDWASFMPADPDRLQPRVFTVAEDVYPIFLQIAIVMLGIAFLLMLTSIYNPLEQ